MLMFIKNLLLFSHGDRESVKVLKHCLHRFAELFSLHANPSKNDCFACCSSPNLRAELVMEFYFCPGSLPIRYLGVPLISMWLSYDECRSILDRVRSRVVSWRGCFLSFVGRLQLVQSVLSTIHIYWVSYLYSPKKGPQRA